MDDFEGKDQLSTDKEGVVSLAPTCPGVSGGLTLPMVYTEEEAGDGRTVRYRYTHSHARDAQTAVTTDHAWLF